MGDIDWLIPIGSAGVSLEGGAHAWYWSEPEIAYYLQFQLLTYLQLLPLRYNLGEIAEGTRVRAVATDYRPWGRQFKVVSVCLIYMSIIAKPLYLHARPPKS